MIDGLGGSRCPWWAGVLLARIGRTLALHHLRQPADGVAVHQASYAHRDADALAHAGIDWAVRAAVPLSRGRCHVVYGAARAQVPIGHRGPEARRWADA